MKFNTTQLFTLLVAVAQVNGKGYECGKHVVVQEGEECSNYLYSYTLPYVREKDLYYYNPTLDCGHLAAGTKICLEADIEKYHKDVKTFTIRSKDTVQSLAKKFKTSEEILRRINVPLFDQYKNDERLKKIAGQEIIYRKNRDYVPDFSKSEDVSATSSNAVEVSNSCKCSKHVVVPEGGKCEDFTHKYDIPYVRMKDLTAFNPTVDCDHLSAGTKLCLEGNGDNCYDEYYTKKGDTLESIAKKLNVDKVILKKVNQPIFDESEGPKRADLKIYYRKNGEYSLDFSESEEIKVTQSNENKSENGNGYKCNKHVVVSEGAQCSDYAHKYDIPYVRMKDLTAFNPTVDCEQLTAGTKLCLEPSDEYYSYDEYFTEKGDTLESLAKKLNVSKDILKKFNQPVFDEDEGPKRADLKIYYRKNGAYSPDFSESEEVKVSQSNVNKNENGNGYKCNKHVVVSEGAQCSDYTHKYDIPYVRMKDLLFYNPTLDCDHLTTNAKLCLEPDYDDYDNYFSHYVIKKGDTYDSIAKELNTDKKILKNLNQPLFNFDENDTLEKKVNQELLYAKTGNYYPDFTSSEEVKSSN